MRLDYTSGHYAGPADAYGNEPDRGPELNARCTHNHNTPTNIEMDAYHRAAMAGKPNPFIERFQAAIEIEKRRGVRSGTLELLESALRKFQTSFEE